MMEDLGMQAEILMTLPRWGVRLSISSPHYPQNHGHAESAMKAVKHLMEFAPSGILNEDLERGLLEHRNTQRQDGRSPAQASFGHGKG